MIFKTLIWTLSIMFLAAVAGAASNHQISVTVDGQYYQCDGNTNPVDPNCVKDVADWCNYHTSYSSSTCFDKATEGCKGSHSGFTQCVVDSANYCNSNTSYSSSTCFDKAVAACKGHAKSLMDLMEEVKSFSAKSARK